jgi:mono/diheme cytochrome c family protein
LVVRNDLRYLAFALLAVAVAAVVFLWIRQPSLTPISPSTATTFDEHSVARGADLAAVGYCADCHTVPGRPSYSGGRALPTPFGTIFSSNLTPDRATGIGKWSEAAFRRAMRDGVDRAGHHLYPAFPYDHFTHVTDADIRDLYAFLMSRPAISNKPPRNELTFPFNIRTILAGWNLLFLSRGEIPRQASKSDDWNRGRYLAEGLGHCGSCHTPRNLLGAEEKSSAYAGGVAEGWNAPALDASLVSAHPWTVDELTTYLSTGWQHLHGAAAGPMAEVSKSLGRITQNDVHAIATYIASLNAHMAIAEAKVSSKAQNSVSQTEGAAAIYEGACARCHDTSGDVGPSQALQLSLSTAVRSSSPANVVRVIMQGIPSYRLDGGPYMPNFGHMLTDAQIAALTQYVRNHYSDQAQWGDVDAEVARARKEKD